MWERYLRTTIFEDASISIVEVAVIKGYLKVISHYQKFDTRKFLPEKLSKFRTELLTKLKVLEKT